ncbi:uncharacterized protein [Patagioenas fasciata]|uniref:uncharacterized protein n=1 Tax=Patagioenas fasciata TaxID=372321 RepID=UPI003A99F4A4
MKKKAPPPPLKGAGGGREPGDERYPLPSEASPKDRSTYRGQNNYAATGPPVTGRSVHLSSRPPRRPPLSAAPRRGRPGTPHPPPRLLFHFAAARPQPRGDVGPSPARRRPMPVQRCRGAMGEPAPSRNGSALGRRRGPAPAGPSGGGEPAAGSGAGGRRASRAPPSPLPRWLPGWALAEPRCAAPRPAGSGYRSRGRRSQCGAAWRLQTAENLPEGAPVRRRVGLDRQENAPAGEAAPERPRPRSRQARRETRSRQPLSRAGNGARFPGVSPLLPPSGHGLCHRGPAPLCSVRMSALPLGRPPLSPAPSTRLGQSSQVEGAGSSIRTTSLLPGQAYSFRSQPRTKVWEETALKMQILLIPR